MTAVAVSILQGTTAWHEHRAKHFNASDASAMAGVSKYKTRSQLLREKATGITPDVDESTQRRFSKGHEYEATARPWAEEIICDELFPVVLSDVVDGLPLSASLDGLTMLGDVAFEHKSMNAELDDALSNGIIPDEYHWQMEQQLMLSGASKCLFMASNGERETMRYAWYMPRPEIRAKLIAGWAMFEADLASYQHVESKPAPVAAAIEALPALLVQVEGKVIATNLDAFKETALAYIGRINTNLQTDQDFADAEKTVKFLKDGESQLEMVKVNALAQTASIDELFRAIDAIREEMKQKRLDLDRKVKVEKENRKAEIITQARHAIEDHIRKLNQRIGGNWMPAAGAQPFADAIKGLKSIDSMRDKVATALSNAKIEANEIADRIDANMSTYAEIAVGYETLFPDIGTLVNKPAQDFSAVVLTRINQHAAQQQQRVEAERERIRQEEEAKAEAAAEQAERERKNAEWRNTTEGEPATPAGTGPELARSAANKPVDTGATIRLGVICQRLGFDVTAVFLNKLGIAPFATEGAAKIYRESDFKRICEALVRHISYAAEKKAA